MYEDVAKYQSRLQEKEAARNSESQAEDQQLLTEILTFDADYIFRFDNTAKGQAKSLEQKNNQRAQKLFNAYRVLVNELARLRAELSETEPVSEAIPPMRSELRSYCLSLKNVNAEIFSRAQMVSLARAEVIRLRQLAKNAPLKKLERISNYRDALTCYFRVQTDECIVRRNAGELLDAGHIRNLCQAACSGVVEAAELLAQISMEKQADKETFFWLKRVQALGNTRDKGLQERISEASLKLSDAEHAELSDAENRLAESFERMLEKCNPIRNSMDKQ